MIPLKASIFAGMYYKYFSAVVLKDVAHGATF